MTPPPIKWHTRGKVCRGHRHRRRHRPAVPAAARRSGPAVGAAVRRPVRRRQRCARSRPGSPRLRRNAAAGRVDRHPSTGRALPPSTRGSWPGRCDSNRQLHRRVDHRRDRAAESPLVPDRAHRRGWAGRAGPPGRGLLRHDHGRGVYRHVLHPAPFGSTRPRCRPRRKPSPRATAPPSPPTPAIDERPALAGRLADLEIPTLVLWGDSDRIADPDYGRAVRERHSDGEVPAVDRHRTRAAAGDSRPGSPRDLGQRYSQRVGRPVTLADH